MNESPAPDHSTAAPDHSTAAPDRTAAPADVVSEPADVNGGSEIDAPGAEAAESIPTRDAAASDAPPVSDTNEFVAEAPPAEPAAAEEPAAEEPAVEEPAAEVPAVEAPAAAEPAADAPLVGASAAETPGADAPAAEAAAAEAPAAETSLGDVPLAEAPAGEAAAPAETLAPEAAPKPPAPPDPRAEEKRRRAQAAWERVVAARQGGDILTGLVTAAVKGGLLVDVGGIRGFLPASQVRVQQGTALDTLVRTRLPLKVLDVDQSRRRIVVSHRRAAEEERRTKRAEVMQSLEVGQVREGTVVRLTDFGAFVDLGGVDGLIPMRELAFERVDKTSDIVTVGEKLPVQVLRIDEGGKKISLSRKNALPDPWRDHASVVRNGATVEGKVVGKEPRLQVEIAPGIVGTVREGDADPSQYEIGESIEVTVRRADRATRRITLSTMQGATAAPPPSNSGGFAPLGIELGRR